MKNMPTELRTYKEEFDFLHKKIGDLEWELATLYLGKKAVLQSDIDRIEDQLENYRENIGILVSKVREEVKRINHSK